MQITFVDLFAGIGGFRCALQFKGARCIFSNEIDKYSLKTYSSWYGNEQINSSDIRSINISKDIPKHDILCAGFPCQPFSIAGDKKGFDDARSNVFWKILEILKTEGYINNFKIENLKNNKKNLKVDLKYFDGLPVIKEIKRISKPGRRVYSRANSIPKVMNGLGLAILSTPKGVMSDTEARKQNVGGEIICRVF